MAGTEEERLVTSKDESSSKNNEHEGALSSASIEEVEESYIDYTDLAIMKNKTRLTLNKLPKMGGQPALAYREVQMPVKLYTSQTILKVLLKVDLLMIGI
jgi:hypothetical protein